ncbi:hypothetical protein PHMEG_00027842 [Phytophthora megakarya]|uniref:DDE-1 domain-containing protein n=1 Tax=Phytophthora megakarya TaxID=4795 RepID=A0A225V6A1_9STRA|nr:hypothetical protein PHMEG_00027842 [Phytophthora megakarya]
MDQTAVYIDMNERTTVDYVGSPTVDVVQGSTVHGFRVSVFLAASATGKKLPPFVVFTGVPGGPVSQAIFNPEFGASTVEHTVQKMHTVMLRLCMTGWKGCGNLLLTGAGYYSLIALRPTRWSRFGTPCSRNAAPKSSLYPRCYRNMPAYGCLCDEGIQESSHYHFNHPFPANPREKRAVMSRIVAEAWDAIPAKVIVNGFIKAGLIPIGPRDNRARFRVPQMSPSDVPLTRKRKRDYFALRFILV